MEATLRAQQDSVVTGHYTLAQRDVIYVALFSGLMGLFLGIATGWQVAVESAQVVAGIVQYPRDNPFAMYHLKTWTLLHQIPAGLLMLGVPERVVALGIGGLTGMVSFMGLALCAYACGANRFFASFLPVLLLGTHVYEEISSVYPVRILSNAPWVLYGCFGTSLVLLVWSLWGVGAKRTAALLMGLAPALHPTMGAWSLGMAGVACCWNWRQAREEWRGIVRYLCLGLGATFASLALHLYLSRDVPNIPGAEKAAYIAAFAANWDSHRRPFPLDHLVMLWVALAVVVLGIWLRFFADRVPQSSQFLLRALFVSAVVSIGLCISTQWQEHLPTVLLMVMPGRFINVVGLAFPAVCLGLLYRNRPTLLGHLMLAGFVLHLMLAVQRAELGWLYVPMPGLIFLACTFSLLSQLPLLHATLATSPVPRLLRVFSHLGPVALAALAVFVGLHDRDIGLFLWTMLAGTLVLRRFSAPGTWISAGVNLSLAAWLWVAALIMLGPTFTLCLAVCLATWGMLERPELAQTLLSYVRLSEHQRPLTASLAATSVLGLVGLLGVQVWTTLPTLTDWNNHLVYAGAHRGRGLLLTASNIRATQLRTQRPVLLEGPALNQLPYVPESGPAMNHILTRVYGEDLFAPRPGAPRGGGLHKDAGRDLWEGRDLHEWQALAREFGFTQIVTYDTWKLKLPKVARSDKLLLYDIPLDDAPRTATRPVIQDSQVQPAAYTTPATP